MEEAFSATDLYLSQKRWWYMWSIRITSGGCIHQQAIPWQSWCGSPLGQAQRPSSQRWDAAEDCSRNESFRNSIRRGWRSHWWGLPDKEVRHEHFSRRLCYLFSRFLFKALQESTNIRFSSCLWEAPLRMLMTRSSKLKALHISSIYQFLPSCAISRMCNAGIIAINLHQPNSRCAVSLIYAAFVAVNSNLPGTLHRRR